MSEEATETQEAPQEKMLTQTEFSSAMGRERAKWSEKQDAMQAQLDALTAEKQAAEAKAEEESKAKMSTSEQVTALESRLEQMQNEISQKEQKSQMEAINNATKDVLMEQGLNPKMAKFALSEIEGMRIVSEGNVIYKDETGAAITQAEALAKFKTSYPEFFSAGRPGGVGVPTGSVQSEHAADAAATEDFASYMKRTGKEL